MKTVYLHVGLHKTGTTSIQRALASLQNELAAAGVQYPRTGIPHEIRSLKSRRSAPSFSGHHLLAWSLVDHQRIPAMLLQKYGDQVTTNLWSKLREELHADAAPRAVLSSEDFEWLGRDGVAQLKAHLYGFELIPIIYFRNPVDYMISMYKEVVKTGLYAGKLRSFVRDRMDLCDYRDRVEVWRQSGIDEIEICSFDEVAARGDLIQDFLKRIGALEVASSYVPVRAENVSPARGVIRIMVWTNRLLMPWLPGRYIARINEVVEKLVSLPEALRRSSEKSRKSSMVSISEIDRLRDSLAEEMDAFCREYVSEKSWHYFKA